MRNFGADRVLRRQRAFAINAINSGSSPPAKRVGDESHGAISQPSQDALRVHGAWAAHAVPLARRWQSRSVGNGRGFAATHRGISLVDQTFRLPALRGT